MRKTINFFGWVSVVLTIISLLATLSTSHQVYNIEYHFMNYRILQWCIFSTMLFWAISFFSISTDKRRYVYSLICLFFAMGSIFFIFMGVK
jgi:cell division protein FtsW (lipid II flippase)